MYKNINKCRICNNSNLIEVLNLGEQYLSNYFVETNENNKLSSTKVPLSLVLCKSKEGENACGLVQLRQTVNRDILYKNYFYRSTTNPMMQEALKNIVDDLTSKIDLEKGDQVLDIGCNDGTMLSYFPENVKKIGIDPAKNITAVKLDKNSKIITDYFSKKNVKPFAGNKKFKAITSIAMFYDLDDPNIFVEEIKTLLDPKGVWCVQLSYLPDTIKSLNFYDVCHEHLEYYTIRVLQTLMEKHDLHIFDASLNKVNGGSLRIFVTHKNNYRLPSQSLKEIYQKEDAMEMKNPKVFESFMKKIEDLKIKTLLFLDQEKKQGGLVLGLGASTKGNVLYQYFNIDKHTIPYISERNPMKVGLKTLGTDIQLISEKAAREMNPSSMFVSIWFFKDEILKREAEYINNGGKLFFPMPYPHIITKNGEKKI